MPCSFCGVPGHGLSVCPDRLEKYYGRLEAYTDEPTPNDDTDDQPTENDIPVTLPGAANVLEDASHRLRWRPDADLWIVLAGLRGKLPDEWMLSNSQKNAFASGQVIRADGGHEELSRIETIQRCDCGCLVIGDCDCEGLDQ